MVTDLALAVVPEVIRPTNPRPVQPVRTSELIIALAVIAAVAMLMATGFMLGRMHQRRIARSRIRSRRLKKRIDSRPHQGHKRNLRLVTPKRR
jgi:hypothetical protein